MAPHPGGPHPRPRPSALAVRALLAGVKRAAAAEAEAEAAGLRGGQQGEPFLARPHLDHFVTALTWGLLQMNPHGGGGGGPAVSSSSVAAAVAAAAEASAKEAGQLVEALSDLLSILPKGETRDYAW